MSTPPFHPLGLDHIVLLVDDMEKALAFYRDVLGCRPAYSYPQFAMEQLWCGTELIVLIDTSQPNGEKARPEIAGGRNIDHFCISISPYEKDAMRAHLAAHDVKVDGEAFHGGARGMGDAVYIFDPFGTKIELKGPPVI